MLPAIFKEYERQRLVQPQLMATLEERGLLHDFQHGFRKGMSVISARVEFSGLIIESVDASEHSLEVFMHESNRLR